MRLTERFQANARSVGAQGRRVAARQVSGLDQTAHTGEWSECTPAARVTGVTGIQYGFGLSIVLTVR
jgi:hypothetical protein